MELGAATRHSPVNWFCRTCLRKRPGAESCRDVFLFARSAWGVSIVLKGLGKGD